MTPLEMAAELQSEVWNLLQARVSRGARKPGPADEQRSRSPAGSATGPLGLELDPASRRGWCSAHTLPQTAHQLLDLYAPLCLSAGPYVIAHLGQSIDGFIAGVDHRSQALNGQANIVHLHRLRALFDGVLIGGNTALQDNPKLTTRLVPGTNPVRVVFDRSLRCDPNLNLFSDGLAPTLLLCAADAPQRSYPAMTQVLRLRAQGAELELREALSALRAEGLSRIFIEGGGVTVSRALQEGVLDRLHVAVAPVVIGAGVPGLRLPELARFADALRPSCETFNMAPDVLFDFALTSR